MGGLTIGVVASLLVFLLILAFFARRNPVLFKLGLRNIPRRRAQTVLIIVGLMLSTAIITAALALGDTVSSLIRNGALDALGATDVVVESPTFAGFGDDFLTAEQVDAVLASVDNDSRVDGAMPQIREDLPLLNSWQRSDLGRRAHIGPGDVARWGIRRHQDRRRQEFRGRCSGRARHFAQREYG